MTLSDICRQLSIDPQYVYALEFIFRAAGSTTVSITRREPGRLGGSHLSLSSLMYLSKGSVAECVWDAVCDAVGLQKDIPAMECRMTVREEMCRVIVMADVAVGKLEKVIEMVKKQKEVEA